MLNRSCVRLLLPLVVLASACSEEAARTANPDVAEGLDSAADDTNASADGGDGGGDGAEAGPDVEVESEVAVEPDGADLDDGQVLTDAVADSEVELGDVEGDRLAQLCGQTGGIWEAGACACAQDGASLHFELDPIEGCRFPDTSELTADLAKLSLLDAIARYTSADQRVFLIDRPGVFDVVTPMSGLDALRAHLDGHGWPAISDAAGACEAALVTDAWPTVACEDGSGLSLEGCFFQTVSDEYHHVSELMTLAVEYEFGTWTTEEIAAVKAEEAMILAVFLSSEHGVTLAFRRLAGAWVLVVVDLSRYSCSA